MQTIEKQMAKEEYDSQVLATKVLENNHHSVVVLVDRRRLLKSPS